MRDFLAPWVIFVGVALLVGPAGLVSATDLATSSAPAGVASPPPSTAKLPLQSISAPAQWSKLNPEQQAALAPLAKVWDTLPSSRQLKWIAVASNFKNLSAADQNKLQSRMQDWVALDSKKRDQARIGFSATQSLPADEKKAKWEQYQSLSDEKKAQLAKEGETKKGAAAKSPLPVPVDKKVNMPSAPAPVSHAWAASGSPSTIKQKTKLADVPEKVAPNTLLPTQKP